MLVWFSASIAGVVFGGLAIAAAIAGNKVASITYAALAVASCLVAMAACGLYFRCMTAYEWQPSQIFVVSFAFFSAAMIVAAHIAVSVGSLSRLFVAGQVGALAASMCAGYITMIGIFLYWADTAGMDADPGVGYGGL